MPRTIPYSRSTALSQELLLALASIVTLGIAAEWVAWRAGIPSILLLLVAGVVAGPVTGFLQPDAVLGDLLFPLVSISVAIILFEGGASLRLDELRHIGGAVRNLVTLGVLVTWLLGAATGMFLLGLQAGAALLLGAILTVTGPTVIVPLLRSMRPVPQVASTLKWEGILIDPIGAVLAVLVFEALVAGGPGAATTAVLLGLGKTVTVGVGIGAAAAGLMIWLLDRQWVPEFLQSPLSLMLVVAAFAASNNVQPESGLLTATLMGMALTNQRTVEVSHIIEFKENLRVLLISSLFIILAARLEVAHLRGLGGAEFAFVAALVLVVRPAAVALSTLRSELSWRERTLIAWVAPRGIVAAAVSAIIALELEEARYAGASQLAPVTFLVIILTVAIYGLTARPLARLLGVALPSPQGVLFVGAHPWARAVAGALHDADVPVRLSDTNYTNVREARMAGLEAYYGSTLTEAALDAVDLDGVGRLLAVTANAEVNSLSALNFGEVFGRQEVYQLPPEGQTAAPETNAVRKGLRGRFLFHPEADYWTITARFDSGAEVKATRLTAEFGYADFLERWPTALPLFLLEDTGRLTVFTAQDPPQPQPGQTIVALVDPRQRPSDTL